ncbi:RloB family protein [Kitasatospora sp. A2-31]|uniref:RloB family protein n=2 Tax=Kitasatospora sp. A2-31 TaxID=2916414 RepID=UPI001EEBB052|nr:RloB family protein [Kitasatospora sp. A2-31]MCG6495060.1 RloB family protein [Kitasatospora sp. A2-31]
MRRGRPLGTKKQSANTREQERRFLVYCEGEVTEKIYLRGLVRDLRGKPISLKIGNSHGEPWLLVSSAIAHAARADEPFDEVWCVLDVEAPQQAPSLARALKLARESGVKCALSSPCFEVWLLLHFGRGRSYLASHQAAKELAKVLRGYDPKGKAFDFEDVRMLTAEARRAALDLHDRHEQPGRQIECWCVSNPCTSVGSLLDALEYKP